MPACLPDSWFCDLKWIHFCSTINNHFSRNYDVFFARAKLHSLHLINLKWWFLLFFKARRMKRFFQRNIHIKRTWTFAKVQHLMLYLLIFIKRTFHITSARVQSNDSLWPPQFGRKKSFNFRFLALNEAINV